MINVVDLVVFVHVIGSAMVLGPLLLDARNPDPMITRTTFAGTLVQLVSGVVMATLYEVGDPTAPAHAKIGTKLALGLVLVVVTWVNQRWDRVPRSLWATVTALAVVQVALGVFWH